MEGAHRPMAAPIDDRALLEIFEYGLDDWIDLSTVEGILKRMLAVRGNALCAELRQCTSALVGQGWFAPGQLDDSGVFRPLTRPLADLLDELCDRWRGRDDLSWWHVVHLEITDAGRAAALELFAELSAPDPSTVLDRRVLFDMFASSLASRVGLGTVADSLRWRLEVADDDLCSELRRYVTAVIDEGWFQAEAAAGRVRSPQAAGEMVDEICERRGASDDAWRDAMWLDLTDGGRAEAVRRFPRLPATVTARMNETVRRDALLWASIEDYAGLWELELELNLLDGVPPKVSNREDARNLLADLVGRAWISLYWSEEPNGSRTPIPSEDYAGILNDDALWDPPSSWHRVVRVSATPEGEAAYQRRDQNDVEQDLRE